jgi:hypothetical protein
MTIWVVDSSSLIAIKENFSPAERKRIFTALTVLVNNGAVIYPPQVIIELGRYADGDSAKQDEVYAWAHEHKDTAVIEPPADVVREVLADPIAMKVVDVNKTGVEEADAYVLALARHTSKKSPDVVVVVQEIRDNANKISMTTACGALRLVRLPLIQFLQQVGILKGYGT